MRNRNSTPSRKTADLQGFIKWVSTPPLKPPALCIPSGKWNVQPEEGPRQLLMTPFVQEFLEEYGDQEKANLVRKNFHGALMNKNTNNDAISPSEIAHYQKTLENFDLTQEVLQWVRDAIAGIGAFAEQAHTDKNGFVVAVLKPVLVGKPKRVLVYHSPSDNTKHENKTIGWFLTSLETILEEAHLCSSNVEKLVMRN